MTRMMSARAAGRRSRIAVRALRIAGSLALLVATLVAACGGDDSTAPTTSTPRPPGAAATPASGENASTSTVAYQDAFAYCAAVGDVLHPTSPYQGPLEPTAVVSALEKASGAAPGGLDHFAQQN